jgi:hypothetical protein
MILDQYDHVVRIFLQDQLYPNKKTNISLFFFDIHIPVVELYVKRQSLNNYIKGYFRFFFLFMIFFTYIYIYYLLKYTL